LTTWQSITASLNNTTIYSNNIDPTMTNETTATARETKRNKKKHKNKQKTRGTHQMNPMKGSINIQ